VEKKKYEKMHLVVAPADVLDQSVHWFSRPSATAISSSTFLFPVSPLISSLPSFFHHLFLFSDFPGLYSPFFFPQAVPLLPPRCSAATLAPPCPLSAPFGFLALLSRCRGTSSLCHPSQDVINPAHGSITRSDCHGQRVLTASPCGTRAPSCNTTSKPYTKPELVLSQRTTPTHPGRSSFFWSASERRAAPQPATAALAVRVESD